MLLCWVAAALAAPARAAVVEPWWELADFPGRAEVEKRIIELTNQERARHDLAPVVPLVSLTTAARQHSREMLTEDYFAHESPHPEWRRPADRAYRSGYWEAYVAENISYIRASRAVFSDEELAQMWMFGDKGWMNSPGHRANILNGDYTHIGVGVAVEGGRYYATQVFGRHNYEFERIELAQAGGFYELTADLRVVGPVRELLLALDRDQLERRRVPDDRRLRLRVAVPADGRARAVGIHPFRDERTYYIKRIFFIDTAQPPERALTMPFEPREED